MIKIVKIDHIALPIDNVADTTAFYAEVLGLEIAPPPPMTQEMISCVRRLQALTQTPAPTGGAWMNTPESQLHLIRAEKTSGVINPFGSHLAFEVEDFDEAKESLTKRGLAFIESPDGFSSRQLWLLDPSGNTVELREKSRS